jgi:class 3 adenylate cyclase/tetratricopeptide (TPR) repeat protein
VITVLFADLAGFTSHTEKADPEDVRERLTVYHGRVRDMVEGFGGRIEKLMGDGVFAEFGSTQAHEDDPERAVRSALRIQEAVEDLNEARPDLELSVRIAVTTGEAVIQLGEHADRERIIGDVVNTASRLQQVAPPGGVVMDERTQRSTAFTIETRPLEPVEVKGKTGAIPLWLATGVRSRFGVAVDAEETAVFVGRRHELELITDAFNRAVSRATPLLVTVVGEPGAGKSRLLHEFYRWIDSRTDLVWWRQGRCLPYGEGITFWALGEIVKSQAGILESEPAHEAAKKLTVAIEALFDNPEEARWLNSRLAPLVGASKVDAPKEELFAAWTRFFESMAAIRPLVMVVEDLHWADDTMLEFIEHLRDEATDAPILMICTARPELFTNRPQWGGGSRDSLTIGLAPLSPMETAELAAALSKRPVMPASAQQALLERSGGNPLYVTEYVRLAAEKGLLDHLGDDKDLPLPTSVQAIIAARLDLLSAEEKSLLLTASVIGKVFWIGALAELMGSQPEAVRTVAKHLVANDFLRSVRRSSMFGQEEFAFAHVLTRDVAYSQLPKKQRAALHEAMGSWLEAGERAEDVPELLAYHYATALELQPASNPEQVERLFRTLMLAGERTRSLDAVRAAEYYKRASAVAPDADARGRALLAYANNAFASGEAVIGTINESIGLLRQVGNRDAELEAWVVKGRIEWWTGDAAATDEDAKAALELAADLPPSPAVASAIVWAAAIQQLRGHEPEAIELADQAISMAQMVGATDTYARALVIRASALVQMGDLSEVDAMAEAQRIQMDLGDTQRVMNTYNNRATLLGVMGQVKEAHELIDEGIEYGRSRGLPAHVEWSEMTKCESLFPMGRWDEVLQLATELIEKDERRGGSQTGTFARGWKSIVEFFRGENVDEDLHLHLEEARRIEDPQVLMPMLEISVISSHAVGEAPEVDARIDEFAAVGRANRAFMGGSLPGVATPMIERGRTSELKNLMAQAVVLDTPFNNAQRRRVEGLVLETEGHFAEAIAEIRQVWEVGEPLGHVFWPLVARIDAARCAIGAGLGEQADAWLNEALIAAKSLKSRRFLAAIAQVQGRSAAAEVG